MQYLFPTRQDIFFLGCIFGMLLGAAVILKLSIMKDDGEFAWVAEKLVQE